MASDPAASVARLIAAIEAGDVDAARAAYHPDARIWHNDDQREQTVDENLAVLGWMGSNLPGLRYTDVRRHVAGDRCIEQHVLEVRLPDRDEPLQIPACLVVTVDGDGRIVRLEEYLDSAQLTPILDLASSRTSG